MTLFPPTKNYNYTLVMAARNGVTDGVFIPGRHSCSYSVPEEDLLLLLKGVRIRGIRMELTKERICQIEYSLKKFKEKVEILRNWIL